MYEGKQIDSEFNVQRLCVKYNWKGITVEQMKEHSKIILFFTRQSRKV